MDKYIEVFCKQNPKFPVTCANPKCKKSHMLNSREVLSKKTYNFKCPNCDKITTIDTSKFAKDFISQMKKLGITVK